MDNEEVVQQITQEPEPEGHRINTREVLDWTVSIAVALIVAFLIRTFVFTMVKVDGQSMDPTLAHGDTLFTSILGYTPKHGDIVIFHPPLSETVREPNKDIAYVKRVIALEGQTVDIKNGEVYVDGKKLDEDYISGKIAGMVPNSLTFPYEVPEGTVFVLGDNRNNSHDSRSRDVGAVPLDNLIGKAQIRVLPLSTFGSLY